MGLIAIPLTGVGSSGGTAVAPGPPSGVVVTSAVAIDTTPDASGNARKLVTVNYAAPSPLGTFAGNWVYLDAPDSANQLSLADGTLGADGTNAAGGVFQPTSIGFFAYTATPASITGTFTGNPSNGETVTIAGKTYTFQASLTNVDGNVLIGITSRATMSNLLFAVDLGLGAGSVYAAATTANSNASGSTLSLITSKFTCTALAGGSQGNSLACSATAPITFSNGGNFSGGTGVNNEQVVFDFKAPTQPQYWRVYLCAGSANAQITPVEEGQMGASPNLQFFVPAPAPASNGAQYAPLVLNPAFAPLPSGWAANPENEVAASGDQYFEYAVTWQWPIANQNFQALGGVNLVLENNTTGIQTYIGNIAVSNGAGNPTYVSPHLPVLPGTNDYTLYLISYDVNGNNNSLSPGVTPQIGPFPITRTLGPAGAEYCALVESDGVNQFVTVVPQTASADGTALLQVTGYFTRPSDPQWGGAEVVVLKPNGVYYSVAKGTLEPIANDVSQPSTVQPWAFFIRSIDINGKPDSIGPQIKLTGGGTGAVVVPVISGGAFSTAYVISGGSGYGTAPTATLVDGQGNPIAGVTLTASVSGGAVTGVTGSGGAGIIATPLAVYSVGSATGALNLAQAAPSSFSSQFSVVGGSTFTIDTINADVIKTGVLQVGFAGTGIPIEVQIFDHLGSLIGWVGDDTVPIVGYPGSGSGFVGGWFKQLYIGGSGPSAAPFQANSLGDVTINGATFTLTAGGVTTTIENTSLGGFGVVSLESSNSSQNLLVTPSGIIITNPSFTALSDWSQPASGLGQFYVTNAGGTGSATITADGQFNGVDTSGNPCILSPSQLKIQNLPSSNPGSGSKGFWYDPSDSNRVKYAA